MSDLFTFPLLIDGLDLDDPDAVDALYEAGCGDALFGERDGVTFAEFDRPSDGYASAILSAISDVERSVANVRVTRVEPEILVSAAEIGRRTGRRQSCSPLMDQK